MPIYHCSVKHVSRKTGRSAVAAAAYRDGADYTDERIRQRFDFTRKRGVELTGAVIPTGRAATWALDPEKLWNAAELAEKRKDARTAREIEIAIPHELNKEQAAELVKEFSQRLADKNRTAVRWAIHDPDKGNDIRNRHAHILETVRVVIDAGLGEKAEFALSNTDREKRGLAKGRDDVIETRQLWEEVANWHLANAGFVERIDHRSHRERGLSIEPTQHQGPKSTGLEKRAQNPDRVRIEAETAARNVERVRESPAEALRIVEAEKTVFTRRDIARVLHRYVPDEDFQNALATAMASPALVELREEQCDEAGQVVEQARYSTRELVEIERAMVLSADRMHEAGGFGVRASRVEAAIARQDAAIQRAGGTGLSIEQREAIAHVTGQERIAAVVGLAGAGKSTLLAAAREAWVAEGFTVHGAALSGKAADGLAQSAGIASRTLASWERGWERGFGQLGPKDVFVIDEAGMVGSRQLSKFIQAAERAGAKIVLVGDPEQLQPIGPGAAFRALAERIGFVELGEIRRQREDWQRAASVDFGRHRTAEGLDAYTQRGCIQWAEKTEDVKAQIVSEVTADMDARPDGTRLVLAHRNTDVQGLNEAIRAVRKERGELAAELVYRTSEGERSFAHGDRLLFRENSRQLGVKNGTLGTVERAEEGRLIVRLDSDKGSGQGRLVTVAMAEYSTVDHGYATTIHKAQGATVDRAYVLASETMDRHLTYVAMTRHRDDVQLYAGRDEFAGRQGGVLVEHGPAPYEHNPENRESYYVTLERGDGERHTIWGVGLRDAVASAASEVGDRIGLEVAASEPVRLPDGTTAMRHTWQVRTTEELAQARLAGRLSRAEAKESTLDYQAAHRAKGGSRQPEAAQDRPPSRRGRWMEASRQMLPGRTPGVTAGLPERPSLTPEPPTVAELAVQRQRAAERQRQQGRGR